MRYRQLGRWGLRISEISLGAWTTYGDSVKDKESITEITRTAYEGGVNFFDNADEYAQGVAEQVMGEVLSDFPRHTLVMSSKVYWPMSKDVNDRGLSRKHVRESIVKSLARLRTDYLDLYFAHRYDDAVSMEEIVTTFSGLVDEGKVLYWGTSEWPPARIAEAVAFARGNGLHPPACEQPQYSMLYRERVENTILGEVEAAGMGLVVWSPLAGGLLTGKYDDGFPEGSRYARDEELKDWMYNEERREKVKALKPIAEEIGLTRSQLALAWVLRHPALTSAITGATNVSQIEESLGASEVEIPAEVLEKIDTILE
ncbi:L-glyceraldehyde 3-phosphate reductase [bacterium BMS3Abin02]|nr:L-glyceraldehyde 3-phosphate reductase [bacterium BMS3Abin02]GBE22176.1 L-glyceraldehyde 3-phosphate reductase [bacterium BMS3Bbin01]HDH24834.1 aldo/keto reductase [Actinomycetota bacterium]